MIAYEPFVAMLSVVLLLAVAFMIVVGYVSVLMSGWWFLARRFPKPPNAHPRTSVRHGTVSFGWRGTYRCIRVGVSEAGLFLSLPAWFCFGHSPMLVPWHDIVPLGTQGRWRWFERDVYRVGGTPVGFPTGSAEAALVAKSFANG